MMKTLVSISTFTLIATNALFSQSKPNVLYIMTDQQTYNMMSCTGNKWVKTPNMDKISNMGYRFDKTYCVNPVSMPSRFSLLTGRYSSEFGLKANLESYSNPKMNEMVRQSSVGQLFRKEGYETLYSGKMHLYGAKGNLDNYGFKLNNVDPYDGPAIYAEQILPELAQNKKPFFLFLSFLNPHDICYKAGILAQFPNGISEANARETIRLRQLQKNLSKAEYQSQIPPAPTNTAAISGEVSAMVSHSDYGRKFTEEDWDLYRWMYYRLTESVDAQIGRVLAALEASGLSDNTIIVFTSDHGEMNQSHELINKNCMFEECQRVPFIFAGKGIKSNFVDKSTLVCNGLDFLPTICDLAGIDIPKNISGVSLKPYLTDNGKKPDRNYIITEDYNAYGITDGRYKYTIYEAAGYPEMLTDIEKNPGETINFINDNAYKTIKESLKKELMSNLNTRGLLPLKELSVKLKAEMRKRKANQAKKKI